MGRETLCRAVPWSPIVVEQPAVPSPMSAARSWTSLGPEAPAEDSDQFRLARASGRGTGIVVVRWRPHGAATVAAPCDLGLCPPLDGGATVAPPCDLGLYPVLLNCEAS